MSVRTLVLQSTSETSQYWVMALMDLPKDSICDPSNYTQVTDGAYTSLLFNWTIGMSSDMITFTTNLIPTTLNEYANIYIVRQDSGHKGTLGYNTPIQK